MATGALEQGVYMHRGGKNETEKKAEKKEKKTKTENNSRR